MLWSPASLAQVMPDDVISVSARPDPDFDPLGMPVRSFLIHPSLQLREQYNDNIFADDDNEQSDFITNIRPSLVVRSNWDIHALRVFTSADLGRHLDNSNEDYEDFRIGAAGRYDIAYDTFIDGDIRYDNAHEDRSSPDDAGSDDPTEIDILSARLGFTRALGRLKLFFDTRARDIEFEDASANGVTIDNSFRNRFETEADLKLAYEFIPNYEVFARGVYDDRNYESTPFPDRSSEGFRTEIGTAINISGKVKGEIHGGYISQNYQGVFDDINAADYGGSLLWNITALTSLRAGLDRDVIETSDALASGYIRTSASAGVEHSFDDGLLGILALTYDDDEFVGIERDDQTLGASLDLEYKPFRGMEAALRYDFRTRESDAAFEDFSNHRITLRLGYSF